MINQNTISTTTYDTITLFDNIKDGALDLRGQSISNIPDNCFDTLNQEIKYTQERITKIYF